MKKKKLVIIALLLLVVLGMGVGYSILSKQLKIEGTATIESNYDVRITGIEKIYATSEGEAKSFTNRNVLGYPSFSSNTPSENNAPTFTSTTAIFDVTLKMGTSIAYVVTIENTGNVDAYIESINLNKTGATSIKVDTPIDLTNSLITPGEKLQMVVIVSLESTAEINEDELTSNISIEINTKQFTNSVDVKFGQNPYILWDLDLNNDIGIIKLIATSGNNIDWSIEVNGESVDSSLITEKDGSYVLDCSGFKYGDEVTVEFVELASAFGPNGSGGVALRSNQLKLNMY